MTDDEILKSYKREAKKQGRLTREEEVVLISTIRRGERKGSTRQEKDAAIKARQRFVLCNLRLVLHTAQAMSRRRVTTMTVADMVQEGITGLMRSLDTYDPQKGIRFSTYSVWRIRQAIARGAMRDRTVHVPEYLQQELWVVHQYQNRMRRELGREPTREEVSELSGVDLDKVELLLAIPSSCLCLDLPLEHEDKESGTLAEVLSDPEAEDFEQEALFGVFVLSILAPLAEREQDILMRRYGLSPYKEAQSLQEIADVYGISRERVRQVLEKVLATIRSSYKARAS